MDRNRSLRKYFSGAVLDQIKFDSITTMIVRAFGKTFFEKQRK